MDFFFLPNQIYLKESEAAAARSVQTETCVCVCVWEEKGT